jgi:nucleoid DNA-binding protein
MEKLAMTRAQLESVLKRVMVQTLAENIVVVPANEGPKPKSEQVADLADLDPLTRKVAQALGLRRHDAAKAIRVVFEALAEVLRENLDTPDFRLRVHALGTFRAQHFAARNRSNPRTAMITWVPAHNRLAFRFTVGLRELGKPRG